MPKKVLAAAAYVSFTVLSSCMSTGQNFSSNIEWVKPNITKQKDVSMILGQPFSVGNSSGLPTWTYAYYTYRIFGKSYYKELKLYWDKDSSVKHFNFSSSFPDDVKIQGMIYQQNQEKNPEY